jgi:hypothetical protein
VSLQVTPVNSLTEMSAGVSGSRGYAGASARSDVVAGTQQQQQQGHAGLSTTHGMLNHQQQPQLKRSFSDPHCLGLLHCGDSNDSSSVANRDSRSSQQQQQAKHQFEAAATAAAAAAADASTAPLMLEIPTVAVRRCMLQTSTEKFSVNLGRCQSQVEVRSIGLYRFKGVQEPVHMVAVSTQRLAGRWFPEAAPSSKVSPLHGCGSRIQACLWA